MTGPNWINSTLDIFKYSIRKLARPNRFYVEISGPHEAFYEDLQFTVQDAILPNRSIGNITIKYYGQTIDLPGDSSHADLTIRFINQYGNSNRSYFENWQEYLHGINSGFMWNPGVDLSSALDSSYIIVTQIGDNAEDLARYKFYDVFPKEVSEIKLSMESINAIETFDVIFSYSKWERIYEHNTIITKEETTSYPEPEPTESTISTTPNLDLTPRDYSSLIA